MEVRVLDLAVELAIRERAGAALAELDVGFRIQRVLAPQAPGVLGPFTHRLAAFEDDRPETHLRQHQSSEQAAGAGADDDRALGEVFRGTGNEAIGHVRRRDQMSLVGEAGAYCRFVAQGQVNRIDEQDGGFLARIVASAKDGVVEQVGIGDAEALHDGRAQCVRRMIERQFQFIEAQHPAQRSLKGLWQFWQAS